MNHDVFDYHIHIDNFSNLLLWLMLVCLAGFCLTGFMMLMISRFFLTKTGARFSIIDFELPFSYTKFKGIIDGITDKTKDTVRMNLNLGYYFIIFAYGLLFFGGWYVLQQQSAPPENGIYKILWLPFVAWVFNILENKMAFACLEKLNKANAKWLLLFSLIKWLLVAGYVVFMMAVYFSFVFI